MITGMVSSSFQRMSRSGNADAGGFVPKPGRSGNWNLFPCHLSYEESRTFPIFNRDQGEAHARRGEVPDMKVDFKTLSDESLLAYYESIRRQVAADIPLGRGRRLAGQGLKRYARELQKEIEQRRLPLRPDYLAIAPTANPPGAPIDEPRRRR
jgi:hypothetical protein